MNVVQPRKLYLGQKDYQQCMVIKKLLSITGSKAEIVICPTLREQDGLAMSSRNMRLTKEQRANATGIFKTLIYLKDNIKNSWAELKKNAGEMLAGHNLVPDYIEIADADTLELLDTVQNQNQVVVLIAAYMGEVRLIDNMIIPLNFAPYGN
ncbi:MAG: pantoate--beta-alanine ligase [Agriterribacter sp.]